MWKWANWEKEEYPNISPMYGTTYQRTSETHLQRTPSVFAWRPTCSMLLLPSLKDLILFSTSVFNNFFSVIHQSPCSHGHPCCCHIILYNLRYFSVFIFCYHFFWLYLSPTVTKCWELIKSTIYVSYMSPVWVTIYDLLSTNMWRKDERTAMNGNCSLHQSRVLVY